jgi:hypothetical protein
VIDTLPDQTSVVVGNAGDDSKVAMDTLNPNADRAIGDANADYRFVLSGVWDLNYYKGSNAIARQVLGGWQLSSILNGQSGRYFTARTNIDLNNDGNRFSDRAPNFGRNTIEGPGFMTVDLRLSKDIAVTERVRFRLMGEAFNLFNRANFTTLQLTPYNFTFNAAARSYTSVPTANFLAPTNTADPRILQLAARFTF